MPENLSSRYKDDYGVSNIQTLKNQFLEIFLLKVNAKIVIIIVNMT